MRGERGQRRTSWNVVSMADVFWESLRRSAILWRILLMGTRRSLPGVAKLGFSLTSALGSSAFLAAAGLGASWEAAFSSFLVSSGAAALGSSLGASADVSIL